MKSFQDKIVVVTGAGSGMGRSYALEAARRGAVLALNDLDGQALRETVAMLPAGTKARTEVYDVSDRAATHAFAARVADELGNADVVINNAGVEGHQRPVWAASDEEFEHLMQINFWGVFHGTRAFLPQLLDGRPGSLVNVSSLFGLVGAPHQSDYCAAKFAVRGFTESLSAELLHTKVTVHLVHPGGVATNIAAREASRRFEARYLRTSPDEVAEVVLDAVGTGQGRIVVGHRARSTYRGVRALPQRLMARLVRRDLASTLDMSAYPARKHLELLTQGAPGSTDGAGA